MRTKPKVTQPLYHDGVHEIVLEVGNRGGSVNSMAIACGVSRKMLYLWAKRHAAFAVSLDKARQYAQEYWENVGKANLNNGNFRDQVWVKIVRRFADYRGSPHRVVKHKHRDKVTATAIVQRVTTRSASAAE